jgi:hypothetical protein
MELGIEDDFDKIPLHPKSESVFFHEYIHFLQDILTTNGINNIRNILLLLRDKISYMQKNNYQKLPVNFKSLIADDFEKQFLFTYGINDEDKIKRIIINENSTISKICFETECIGEKPLDIYYLKFEGNADEYQLGTIDIMESMAFLLEKYCFGNDSYDSPALPYKTIDMIICKICPNSFPCIEYVIAMCELSLSTGNPMMFFMETMKKFRDTGYKPKSLDDFVNKVFEDVFIECNGNIYAGTGNPYLMIMDEVIRELKYIFGNDTYFKNVLLWFDTLFEKVKEIKNKEKFLPITKLFISKNPIEQFHELICNTLGTPIIYMENNKRGYYLEGNKATPELFLLRVLENFFYSLYDGSVCMMREYCKEKSRIGEEPDMTDDNCITAPSLRSGDNYTDLCPYAALWKYFKLISKVEYRKTASPSVNAT